MRQLNSGTKPPAPLSQKAILMRRVLTTVTALAAVTGAAFSAPGAEAAAPRQPGPGQVSFWSDPNEQGTKWTYTAPGYQEASPYVKRHAYSFSSNTSVSVFAISHRADGTCLYREIRPDDVENNWTSWATKFDGVSDSNMGCSPA
ncbi:hypothetical protein [Streptomyces sp. NPDC001137]|uniref:hypothetical protein n=1 Tax=Streptomyces sp. NPDC001137 TaxID=3154378 RepID=UPI00331EAA5F